MDYGRITRGRWEEVAVGATRRYLTCNEIMKLALPMYLQMGFEWHHEAPQIHGVPYAVHLKRLLPDSRTPGNRGSSSLRIFSRRVPADRA